MTDGTRTILAIAVGGALGSVLRFGVAQVFVGRGPGGIVVGTLAVNLVGSAALTFLMARHEHGIVPATLYAGLTTGLLGGFTTYSTFNGEVVRHLVTGHADRALAYVLATVLSCLAGGAVGWSFGQR